MNNPINDYDYFSKWYDEKEKEFHTCVLSKKEMTYSAFLEGIKYCKMKKGEMII